MSDDPTTIIADPALEATKVTTTLAGDAVLGNSPGDDAWITKRTPESITDAMNQAPMGSVYEITYAVLSNRMRQLLTEGKGLNLAKSFVYDALNFRSLNANFYQGGDRHPTVASNAGAGAGQYASKLWGNNHDERLPQTLPKGTSVHTYGTGQDPTPLQNKGTLIAKLYQDLESHLPLVLFNVTSKETPPIGIGGASNSRSFYKDGTTVTEIAYKADLEVEVLVFTEDDHSTSHLQALVETAFGMLRDHIGSGSEITGPSWSLTMPTKLVPSPISSFDAPWANGDEKGSKLYSATINLSGLKFEAFTYVGKRVKLRLSEGGAGSEELSMSVPGQDDPTQPIRMVIGQPQRLTISGAPLDADVLVSDGHRVLKLRKPYTGTGFYELLPRRTGEATLKLYPTGMILDITDSTLPSGRAQEPLLTRKVVVSAV